MKRAFAFVLLLCMLLGLCACGGSGQEEATQTTAPAAPGLLDGKKIIFIGNSHTYVGNVVSQVYNKEPRLDARDHNMGLFYLLCKNRGSEVNVINWTFSSHVLSSIFGEECTVNGACQGMNHTEYLTDRFYDYVVIQPGVGTNSEMNIASDIANVVDFFRAENPDVKFVLLGNASVYGNNKDSTPYPGITGHYKVLADEGFIIADWGKLVNDLIHNIITPEGSTVTYNKSCFIIKDGFHPNYLSGYIASVMTYCAITGESAADIPADMFQDSSMVIALDAHLANSYENPDYDTNCKIVLTTPAELERIHLLIDQYLAEKPYLQN